MCVFVCENNIIMESRWVAVFVRVALALCGLSWFLWHPCLCSGHKHAQTWCPCASPRWNKKPLLLPHHKASVARGIYRRVPKPWAPVWGCEGSFWKDSSHWWDAVHHKELGVVSPGAGFGWMGLACVCSSMPSWWICLINLLAKGVGWGHRAGQSSVVVMLLLPLKRTAQRLHW